MKIAKNGGTTATMIDGYNSDIKNEQVQKLSGLFPEVITEGKIDFEKLRDTLGDVVDRDGERYGLSWKGKSNVFAKIQEKTVSTLHPQPEESVDWDTTQNMFIEGDNLEALKVLHKAYYGKIKMIYIDPPYNTGNDFVYNDDFKKTRREQALEEGAIDEEGNVTRDDGLRANTGGHKHSNWLDMMYPRLFLARNLLRQDGVIFVSIDDNEVHNLRLMMNEIFGEENFIAQITIKSNPRGSQSSNFIAEVHEYVLLYARNSNKLEIGGLELGDTTIGEYKHTDENGKKYRLLGLRQRGGAWRREQRPKMYFAFYVNPITGSVSLERDEDHTVEVLPKRPSGEDSRWAWGREKSQKDIKLLVGRQVSGEGKYDIFRIDYLEDTEGNAKSAKPKSVWDNRQFNYQWGRTEIKELFKNSEIFDFPKPTHLIKTALEFTTEGDDIVVDFFAGSGTTAHAVIEQNAKDGHNRSFIAVQLPEQTNEKSEARKAGYKTISDISRERIRRAGVKISKDFSDKIAERETPLDLGFRTYALVDSNFKKWNELVADPEEIKQQTLDNLNPLEDGASNDDLLTEILLKRGISPLVEIEAHDDLYFVPSEKLAISLTRKMTEELFAQILTKSPSQIILLDQAFKDDVNLKTNLILQAEKQSVTVEVL